MQDEITIRLTAQQLDVVANALGQRPYIEAAPVIEVIRQQVIEQDPNRPTIAPPPNGPHPDANDGVNAPALQ